MRNYGCYSAHVLYEKGHSRQIDSLNWKLQWHLHDAKSWRQMSPILGFYFYLCHYRRRFKSTLLKRKKEKKTFFLPFLFIFRLSICWYCLEEFSGHSNANISQASSVTVDALGTGLCNRYALLISHFSDFLKINRGIERTDVKWIWM